MIGTQQIKNAWQPLRLAAGTCDRYLRPVLSCDLVSQVAGATTVPPHAVQVVTMGDASVEPNTRLAMYDKSAAQVRHTSKLTN